MSEGLIGVVIGGVLSFLATFLITFLEKCGERERFSKAITSEIKSIIYLTNKRKYRYFFEEILSYIEETKNEPLPFKIIIENDYFPVFSNNLDKIGFLKNPKSEEVVRFYTLCKALLEDIRSITEGEWHGLGIDHWKQGLNNMILLYEEAFELHENIVKAREKVPFLDSFAGRFF